jgi:hypothetical protein
MQVSVATAEKRAAPDTERTAEMRQGDSYGLHDVPAASNAGWRRASPWRNEKIHF